MAFTGAEIRTRFLKFYEEKGHQVLPSASLVPSDPTVLLTIAGMLPFKPIFLGQEEPPYPRVTTAQKCVRTNDIENVGKTARHHTFFEMLGNFSFGDYFKKEAISWGWELVTEVFQLPPDRLAVSVFYEDDEAYKIWRDTIGIPAHRIQRLGEDNFWAAGATGPCGPCSEIYYDFHPEAGEQINLEDDRRFLEVYNLVFMELNRDSEGNLTPLAKQNIDTGMGLERMAQVLQGVPNNYETDLIFPIIAKISEIAGVPYHKSDDKTKTHFKVMGDHMRAVVYMVADGITASNVGRGYVLRRLLRRVVRYGKLLGIEEPFTATVADQVIALGASAYPELQNKANTIKEELTREEDRFRQTLERGEKLLVEILARSAKQIAGVDAFTLYDTYGFPLELTEEIAAEQGLTVDREGFDRAMAQQQQRSKEAHTEIDLLGEKVWQELDAQLAPTRFVGYDTLTCQGQVLALVQEGEQKELVKMNDRVQLVLDVTPFYAESGGQVGDKGEIRGKQGVITIEDVQKQGDLFLHFGVVQEGQISVGETVTAAVLFSTRRRTQAHHSATHLLQAALKKIVDPQIGQAGSLVDSERLRFDFNLPRPLTAEEIRQVEAQVNQWILEGHTAQVAVMPLEEAKAKGAIAMFGEKYGAEVRVIDFPGVSMELCGGTHVHNTAEIGLFKIVSETGVAAGIRRIEAVTGQAVLDYLAVRDQITKELSDRFKAKPEEIIDRVTQLQDALKQQQKETENLKRELALLKAEQLLTKAETVASYQVIIDRLDGLDGNALQTAAEKLVQKLGDKGAVILGSVPEAGKVALVAAFGKQVTAKGLQAGKFIGQIARICGGGGGGRPHIAQAGGKDTDRLPEALATARQQLQEQLT
ncbi:MAG: alanine--tRNA ligase [Pseudanabaenaceae cyanobacterium SKYGB_i_bin29]|nr:alanine--tRNA ligase [Pseudanabaenaceae cyanobacterium SKYG29]MDW8422395.1 alanine--tRNA ligase [Pseudanabaenaceae cyanobacterium SKYGB_i_bin29]